MLGEEGATPGDLWFVLHGYRQLAARFLARFRFLRRPGLRIVAPEGLSRFYLDDAPGRHGPESRVGATWMTREDRDTEIRDYVEYLDLLHHHVLAEVGPAARVGILGFSQGAHTAARWAVLGRVRPHRLVLWGAYLPEDLPSERAAERLGGTRLVLVQGRDDEHREPELEARHRARLGELGLDADTVWHDGGHALEPGVLRRVMAFDAKA